MLETDAALLQAFRNGDTEALTRVYRTYSPRVLEYLARGLRLRSSTGENRVPLGSLDVEAAHQETFVRAFRPAARLAYDGLRPYEGLLLTIARHAAVDLLRASGRAAREAVSLEEVEEAQQLASEGKSPEAQALEGEARSLVRRFLQELPELQRELARLRFIEGQSQVDAAAALGLTRGELRVQERRVREQLTRFLTESGWLDPGVDPVRNAVLVLWMLSALWPALGASR